MGRIGFLKSKQNEDPVTTVIAEVCRIGGGGTEISQTDTLGVGFFGNALVHTLVAVCDCINQLYSGLHDIQDT